MPSPSVGNTLMFKSIQYSGKCKGATVHVKDESTNPFSHTFKDRRCAALLDLYNDRPEIVLVHSTSGNSGISLGMMAKEEERKTGRKITVVNLVDKSIPPAIKERLAACSLVHEVDLTQGIVTFEDMRKIARKVSGFTGDEKNILGVEDYGLANGYRAIIREIAADGVKPTHVVVPGGEGELASELAAAAEEVWGNGAPKIICVTIPGNVLVEKGNFLKKVAKNVADKLRNGYSKFKELIQNFVKEGRMELMTVTESQIAREYKYLSEIGISAEPSAAAAFAGALKYPFSPHDTVVIINTGKGPHEQNAVEKVWARRARKWLGNAAIFAAGIIAAIGITVGYERVRAYVQEHRHVRQEMESVKATNMYLWERERVDSAMRVNSGGGLQGYGADDARSACRLLGKPKKVCDKVYTERDFTNLEIYFLYKVDNISHDYVMGHAREELIESWRNGTYQPDGSFYEYYPECQQNGAAPVPNECFGPLAKPAQ